MATVSQLDRIAPMLRVRPSLPRPILARLTARLIDRMDELDGDPDLEESEDLEQVDDREVEDYEGGHPNPPHYPPPPRRVAPMDVELGRIRQHLRWVKRRRCMAQS